MKGGGLARIDASPERGEVGERERGIFVTSPEHGQIGKGWLNIDHDRSSGVNGDEIAALHPFVAPEFRRKGVGTALYLRAAELARGRAVEPTSQPSAAANKLWETLNWRIDPKQGRQFSRQPQQFGRSMGYAVDVPEQAFARETHPMLQMAIDRSLQRPHRSSMPPEIGHPRSPLEYTGAGPVVVRSAPQDLTPEAFGPGNHIVTGEMPISRRRPNFQPIREPRFNPDAAHDEVVRLMLGRLPRRRYNGKPDEPWVVRANDEWNSDPTTFQRYQQAFAVDDPNSPRRVWQTPPVVKPQAPKKPDSPSRPEEQDPHNARVLANYYSRPAVQPSKPKEPGFGQPSARQGEGLSEDWIKNFVKRGDDQSNEFAPPWMRGAGYEAPWNRGRGPEKYLIGFRHRVKRGQGRGAVQKKPGSTDGNVTIGPAVPK
jgi:GNAT superfamily N-acetyltransferase